MLFYFLLPVVIFCIFMSLRTFLSLTRLKENLFQLKMFVYLGTVYLTVIIGYGLIYVLFHLNGMVYFIEINGLTEP